MSQNSLAIAYYISGHGYGHAARACQVIAALPQNVKIVVRTMVDEKFILRESGRSVKVIPGQFDTGVVQKDNLTLDWPATIKLAHKVIKAASSDLLNEAAFLRRNKIDLVVSDVAAAPMEAARMAGLPGVVIGNFTWVEIFERETQRYPEAGELAQLWREQYALATLAIRTEPAFPMKYFRHRPAVELIARRGKSIRSKLEKEFRLPKGQRLVLLYFGTFGDDDLRIPQIQGTTFLAFTPMPGNVIQLDPQKWKFPDVVASSHCVIAKPGYGTIGECMANGTPVIYHPRQEFAEYPLLRKAIEDTGSGVMITRRNLTNGNWSAAIEAATSLENKELAARGAAQAAHLLMELID